MQKSKLRKNLLILIIMNSALILVSVAYAIYFSLTKGTDAEIVCVIKESFGFYCPACGGSRSVVALLRFDLVKSFIYYPPIIISALVILGYDVRLLLTLIKKDTKYTDSYKFYPFIIIAVSVILNFLVRNLLLFYGIDYIGDISSGI